MRLKIYEGENNFTQDDTKYGKREDWYFDKDLGLVRVDVLYFCPYSWGNFANCVPCNANTDCKLNEFMKAPNITMTTTSQPPPPPPLTLFVEVSAVPQTGQAPLSVDLTVDLTGTDPGSYIFRFDCTNDGDWEQQVSNPAKTYTLENACTYTSAGTYLAFV